MNDISRALFLDFDGVLHRFDQCLLVRDGDNLSVTGEGMFGYWPVLVEALAPYPELPIVVHSSWRYLYSCEELKEMLPRPLAQRVVHTTGTELARYPSIQAFVAAHGVKRYLILDDEARDFPSGVPELILTPAIQGVSCPHVQRKLKQALIDMHRP